MGKDDFNRKEIESHSSELTNKRIDLILNSLWKTGYDVLASRPKPTLSNEYFSLIVQYYLAVKDVFEDNDLDEIEKHITEGNKLGIKLRVKGDLTVEETETLTQKCLQINSMLNTVMQKKRYFFRMGRSQPKGLDAALKIFGIHAEGEKEEKKEGNDGRDTKKVPKKN